MILVTNWKPNKLCIIWKPSLSWANSFDFSMWWLFVLAIFLIKIHTRHSGEVLVFLLCFNFLIPTWYSFIGNTYTTELVASNLLYFDQKCLKHKYHQMLKSMWAFRRRTICLVSNWSPRSMTWNLQLSI